MAQGPQCNDERKIPAAACDRSIPATECLAWHVQGRIPGAKLSEDRRVLRFRCPLHDDGKPSAVILVGDEAALNTHCHACGKDAKLEVRAAVIRVYGINPKCLPLSKPERMQQEGMLEAVFTSPYTPCTRLVCVKAILEGIRGAAAVRASADPTRGAGGSVAIGSVPRKTGDGGGFTAPPVRTSRKQRKSSTAGHISDSRLKLSPRLGLNARLGSKPVPDWDWTTEQETSSMSMAEFIFGCVGCVATVIGGCVAIQGWRNRRRTIQAAERIDRATRSAFAQVGRNAAWARGERHPDDPDKPAEQE